MMAEETKAQGSEKYPPARITPLEIEEGRVPSTEGRGPAKPAEKTTCQRYVPPWLLPPLLLRGSIDGCALRPRRLCTPSTTTIHPTTPHWRRHRGKFVCLGITLALLAAGGIVAAVYWPKMPKFTLYSESQINIDLLGTNTAKLMVQVRG